MAKKIFSQWAIFHLVLLAVFLAFANYARADANSDYKAGSDFAKQIKGQGESTLKNFKPESELPNYSANPNESKYYDGVSSSGDKGLTSDGVNNWANSDVGKAVNDSVLNNPKEPISPDAPFITAGKDTEANADKIVGNTDGQCQAQTVNRTEYTNYTCERDLKVEQYCTRTATPVLNCRGDSTTKTLTAFYNYVGARQENGNMVQTWTPTESGEIQSIHFNSPGAGVGKNVAFTVYAFGTSYTHHFRSGESGNLSGFNKTLTAGVPIRVWHTRKPGNNMKLNFQPVTFTIVLKQDTRVCSPSVNWVENCPFSKSEGAIQKTECIEPGSTKTLYDNGKTYPITQSCWAYKDTYMTQAADAGTCKAYMSNPACTLATRQCAFKSEEGTCLHENATYSCETKTSGKVMICGGDVFCLDGECDKAQNGKNNDFAHAVSQLAAVAAAGKNVAALNGIDVRAFTGKAKYCKKFAVGFSNCCKDSGWGNDLGLASCSSEEKALGKAKEKKLTVSIGEFCSKKVLGICLEKKRSYCQFDSKLAQIVQQQGRAWQLGIGFGKAKSPDCRGITVEELQRVNFDKLDFSNFFDDLMNNQKVPTNDALLNKVKEQINNQLKP
ncbi:type-F conjugative transfer system mating-pair stabilization protein TraN [Hafnia alvei]|uniref:type-F conjugative transfer system mating-pair stabilization protein TraN n=1 Tax=Hafnia alvei TaxID=569 RepID=UPI00398B0F3B